MSVREKLAENPAAVAGLAVIVLAAAGWYIASQGRSQRAVDLTWYYDLDAVRLIAGEVGKVPPFTTPDGHTAVHAAVFSCGDCADEGARYIGYLEKYSDAYLAAMGDEEAFTPEVAETGHLVRAPDGGEWFALSSPQGQALLQASAARCPDAAPKGCRP